MADRHAEGGMFLRLIDDGDKAVVAFLGEPFAREVVWGDGGPEPYSEEHKAAGEKPRMLVSINCYNRDQKIVQVFEQGVTWFRQLLKVRDKYGLGKWWFEMQRDGAKGSQKTTYQIFPEEKLTEQEQADLAALDLHDLEDVATRTKDDDGDDKPKHKAKGKSKSDDSNGALDPDVASDLVNRLKELPRSVLSEFLKEFGAKRIRDVPRAKQADAIAFVESHESGGDEDGEVDPFA